MAQTVEDAAALLTVIAEKCPHDRTTERIPFDDIPDYRSFCRKSVLRGARIGIPRNAFKNNDGNEVDAIELGALENTISIMAKACVIIVDPADYPDYTTFFAKSPKLKSIFNNADWKAQFEKYVARLIKNPRTSAQCLISLNLPRPAQKKNTLHEISMEFSECAMLSRQKTLQSKPRSSKSIDGRWKDVSRVQFSSTSLTH
jgi:Asp-tRNA(Asn)/Glu-tRNA(Gln) amidotransferase A subunit family amidase